MIHTHELATDLETGEQVWMPSTRRPEPRQTKPPLRGSGTVRKQAVQPSYAPLIVSDPREHPRYPEMLAAARAATQAPESVEFFYPTIGQRLRAWAWVVAAFLGVLFAIGYLWQSYQ